MEIGGNNMEEKLKVSADTVARTIVLIIALINQVIAIKGGEALHLNEDTVYQTVTLLFTIGASIWSFWKNNSFTQPALQADKVLKDLKK